MDSRGVILVLTMLCFLFNGLIEGLTFSSRIIHRFSDEGQALLAPRDGNVKRNSVEYLEVLLGNDWKRQRMKLGSQSEFVFPAQGSQALSFGNELAWLHYTWIDIGTPNVTFLVALDTGSDLLWVPCNCITCAPLTNGHYSSLDRDLGEYNPTLSSTSRQLPCNHQLCEYSSNCKSSKDPCPYIVDYNDFENTSSSGFLVEDKLHLASVREQETQRVQASVIIGCGRKQSGSYLDGAAPDGVIGLGPGNISVPSLLAKLGLIHNSFSLCFGETDSGRILFGDQGLASQQSTPFLPIEGNYVAYVVGVESCCIGNSCLKRSGFKAFVDSGSSFTYLPSDVYNKIVMEFDKQVNARRISSEGSSWVYCYNASMQEFDNIPPMRLIFPLNQSFVVHNPTYSIPQNQEYTSFCLTLQPTDDSYATIGQNFMTGYHMVFDMENLTLGWSKSNCRDASDSTPVSISPPANNNSSTPLPTNQQQNIPSTDAVAPAVAGRTTSKPSTASHNIPSLLHFGSLLRLLQLLCLFLLAM